MGLFNIFKKKEKVTLQQIIANRKSNSNIYVGQIVSINADIGRDSENYYLCKYPDEYVSNKITKEYIDLCDRYKYAIIREFNDKKIDARVICCNGYLMRLRVDLLDKFDNGSAFAIKDNNLYDNDKNVGKIIDRKYDPNLEILFNELEEDRLVVFVKK